MRSLPVIDVRPLLPRVDAALIELLRGLSPDDWRRPTLARLWTVQDIAAHLLDTYLRRLSIQRDGHFGDPPGEIGSYGDLVGYLNRLNADWVQAFRRVSPGVLTDLLERWGPPSSAYLAGLDPRGKALFPVAWAGEEESTAWFDVAREYTERWHHQQQIRHATGRPGLLERDLYHPVLDTFLRALPHTYREVAAAKGALLRVTVTGEAGGTWDLLRRDGAWQLGTDAEGSPDAEVTIPREIAWRLFTKGIGKDEARPLLRVEGDPGLGWPVLQLLAVMA
ncbi:MAG TPA: maleylpyruvate isomerase family mycothiol-dependent enzyme [Thermoanaerobaculia bacterium]|nr:maleylpyruvate isomerase family mycothiol-dependent enzyme [Thermoanaerobaculia bacterium]